jgi:hypothetical protein
MKRLLQFGPVSGIILLALVWGTGCSRSQALRSTDPNSPGSVGNLPFHEGTGEVSGTGGTDLAASAGAKLDDDVPFRASSHLRTLPAGTLLTVELEEPLSPSKAHAGDEFSASVAAPLGPEGDTLIDRGAAVTGSIESIQLAWARSSSASAPLSGYFRLTLNAIDVGGKPVAIQTSSLFARGTSPAQPSHNLSHPGSSGRADDLRLQKGRRLTFRLTTPVTLSDRDSVSKASIPKAQS